MNRKNNYTKAALLICFLAASVNGFAASLDVSRRVAAAVLVALQTQDVKQNTVAVSAQLEQRVQLKDALLRPARFSANQNQVVQIRQKEIACSGVLEQSGRQVLVPSVCLVRGGCELKKVVRAFSNAQTAVADSSEVNITGDLARINVSSSATQGLKGFAVATQSGRSLQEMYGAEMTEHLKKFFHTRGVEEKMRSRVGNVLIAPRLRVGEPLIYRGQVVALVKKAVSSYGDFGGGVSESAFALVR